MKPFAVLLLLIAVPCSAGEITGKITPPGKCKEIKAVSREMKFDYKGKINSNTGEYSIKDLPVGKVDLILTLADGVIEGVDLSPEPQDVSDEPLTEEDKATISKWTADNFALGKEFENKGRPIYMQGNGKHCYALVEKIRDRVFHAGKDQAVYRVEIWIFDKLYGTWRKRAHAERVVLRERLAMPEYKKKGFLFDPKLGGMEVKGKDDTVTFDYAIPETLDASMGKPAGSIPP